VEFLHKARADPRVQKSANSPSHDIPRRFVEKEKEKEKTTSFRETISN